MELRLRGVEQLGQVRLAILETNGNQRVYSFEDDKVETGLSFYPVIVRSVTKWCRIYGICLRAL